MFGRGIYVEKDEKVSCPFLPVIDDPGESQTIGLYLFKIEKLLCRLQEE
jgi:hypothetical protein